MIYRHELEVLHSSIDANGHANNVEYLRWMQDAALAHSDSSGGTAAAREVGGTWFARNHFIEYLQPANEGAKLVVLTWIENTSRSTSFRRYRIFDQQTGRLLARGETTWVFVSAQTGKPKSIPESVRRCFSPTSGGIEPSLDS
jgi:acyl-CoA thioester hydrolase